jgi:tRNA-specific 2-thiouridylase
VVGKHQGAHYFTKGQRKGLLCRWRYGTLFVIDTDVMTLSIQDKENSIRFISQCSFVKSEEIHWIRGDLELVVGDSLDVRQN